MLTCFCAVSLVESVHIYIIFCGCSELCKYKYQGGTMFFFISFFLKETKKFYYGYTGNLQRRMIEHQEGKVRTTKNRRPMKLAYYEEYNEKSQAETRERQVKKSGRLRKELKQK